MLRVTVYMQKVVTARLQGMLAQAVHEHSVM
jgi:hypothetical protein